MAHDIFISYSSRDKLVADAACTALEENGIRCWMVSRDTVVGPDYSSQLTQAIEDCRAMVIVFSSDSNGSPQVKAEIDAAFARHKILIPLRLAEIEPVRGLANYLRAVHWLDAFPPPLEQHWPRLVGTILRLLPDRAQPEAPDVAATPVMMAEPSRILPVLSESPSPLPPPLVPPIPPGAPVEIAMPAPAARSSQSWPLAWTLLLAVATMVVAGALIWFVNRQATAHKVEVANHYVIEDINLPLLQYHRATGHYPTTAQGLQALITAPEGETNWTGPYLNTTEVPKDPWGHFYQYAYPGRFNRDGYDVWSMGPFGLNATDEEFLGNW